MARFTPPLIRLKGVWREMHYRCKRRNHKSYKDYGGRGITVCPEWESFDQFYLDMGYPPAGLTLERKDNDGPYSKDNCEWADRETQNRNRRNTHRVESSVNQSLLGVT